MAATSEREVVSRLGDDLVVTRREDGGRLIVKVGTKAASDVVLHWGLSRRPGGAWLRPPETAWPQGSQAVDGQAIRTPFIPNDRGEREVTIQLDPPTRESNLAFVLHFPRENRWVKSGAQDFTVPLPRAAGARGPDEALATWVPGPDVVRQTISLDDGSKLAVATRTTADEVRVWLVCDAEAPLLLHWGVAQRFQNEWTLPPEDGRPAGTVPFDQQAVRSPFTERDGLQSLELTFRKPADGAGPRGLRFVLFQPDGGRWLKSGGKDLAVPLFAGAADPRLPAPKLLEIAEQIVGAEKGPGSWTLMHRFNLCHDLLGAVQDDEDGLALLFAWLRYSAIRQLDWQRNYNTKPRELSHAQDRLTARLAGVWRRHSGEAGAGCRRWARLMLTTLGRGGDGQRVRDEILHIMHRNHLREVAGNFIEEWHQKLHNNTTPDDIVICQAYLAFLRANGDRAAFYRALEAGGVTRERLQSFERPIRSEPDYYGDKRDALVGEFENFLRVLKSVHAGADLDTAAGAARGRLDGGLQQKLDGLLALRQRQAPVAELAAAVTAVREGVAGALARAGDDAAVRDLLFLDLGLEDLLRGAVERQQLSRAGRDDLVELVRWALRNVALSTGAREPDLVGGHWAALAGTPRDGRDWALHARSVAERAGRWVQAYSSDVYGRLQPKAEFLGEAFAAEKWTVPLFSEEVIRGGPAFALALLLRHLDPVLRKAAGLGGWQVISPARAGGRVRLAGRLLDVQNERFAERTVLVADHVEGSEEIPAGVTAVLTTDTPDLVAHVSVRARNAGVLFATCFDPATYDRLKALKDRIITLTVTPGGDVEFTEGAGGEPAPAAGERNGAARAPVVRDFPGWVLTQDRFAPGVVGGKSNNLNGLRGRLPDWIHLPASLALPFGACERALADDANRDLRGRYAALVAAAEANPPEVLPRLRALIHELRPPAGLQAALQEAWQKAGLPPLPWEQAWPTIRRVWASKWNDRAFLSRRARGVPHDSLLMAVLVQQVVEADYAYVIHTANPLTGNRGELYAEVVLGLGETLVGNYPGRALGFVCRKNDLALELVSYPGKGAGLYGKGIIFRSDSNGEDLEGFAGAGLYDSFLAAEPEHRVLDYRGEKLVWDRGFRDELLRSIARVGIEVERLLGSPQDVEGAVAGGRFHVVQTRPQVGLRDG